jgi:hypothetical protein
MLLVAAAVALAIVTQDQAALRAAPRDSAQQQVQVWQGDTLEIRGERMDYLQVYDHRRERAGYIRRTQVRAVSLEESDAPELLSVLRFLRDDDGRESLGIAYAAAYLKAAPAKAIDAEPFDALGTMADRLAARASAYRGKADDPKLAAQLEVSRSYGIAWNSFERDGRIQLCYDGDAFRRVLAMPSSAEQKARAALALTRYECVDPATRPLERESIDQWREKILDQVDLGQLPEVLKNRIRMRHAGVLATRVYEMSRHGTDASETANRALQELAAINKSELADGDRNAYTEAAVRVGAIRWAAETPSTRKSGLLVQTTPGQPGETCVTLTDAKHGTTHALLKRCTYSTVWLASATPNLAGNALSLTVQPLDAWSEVWIFRKVGDEWEIKVLPPAASEPSIGYAEFAGWVPGGKNMLVAREAHSGGRWKRSFEVIQLDSMATKQQADNPQNLSTFYRWQSPAWKRQTISLR